MLTFGVNVGCTQARPVKIIIIISYSLEYIVVGIMQLLTEYRAKSSGGDAQGGVSLAG